MLFPILWGQAIYPLWWSSLMKDMQTEQFLCWSDITEHSTISSSNEEEELIYEFISRIALSSL